MHRLISTVAILFLASSLCVAATVDPPARIRVLKLDGSELTGMITSYTTDGFTLVDAQKKTQEVSWGELPADVVMNLHDRLVRKGTADEWMELGRKLLTMPGGRAPAERAFVKALRLDKTLKEKIAALRKEAGSTQPAKPTPPELNGSRPPDRITDVPTTRPDNPFDPRDPQKRVVGPQQIGTVDASAWGKLSSQQMSDAVTASKQFAAETRTALGVNLAEYETSYFLFYTDLGPAEAQKWAGVLDRMYARLSGLFGVASGENVWRGKALVFVFAREADYLKFEIKMHKTVAAGTAGMCHTFGNGDVRIAFYRQPNELDFAHVLVHESVHGFLHRYRSPIPIPSWVNEGLAEAIATDMVQRKGIGQQGIADARQELVTRKSLGNLYTADPIVAWQYPVARTLTEFMISQSKKGYVDFVNGIKDGISMAESMRSKYGVTLEQLTTAYGNSMGVAELKP